MKILSASEMAEVDRLTTEIYRVPSLLLMENAGRRVAEEIVTACPSPRLKRVAILCGRGNNGGDGLVVARYLALGGCEPEVLLFGDPSSLKGDPVTNWQMVQAMGIKTRILVTPEEGKSFLKRMDAPDVIVDALFGTGLSKPIGPDFRAPVDWINRNSEKALVVAVDIPSGLFANSPEVPGRAVRAGLTVTFTAPKPALLFRPAADHAGRVVVASIGSPRALLDNPAHRMELVDEEIVRRVLPPRARESHKGTYGHVFVAAGSRGKSGAALMTGLSALRSGAGLVTLWLPGSLQRDVVAKVPELMTESLPETPAGTPDLPGAGLVLERLADAHALVIGPGVTQESGTRNFVRALVRRSRVPVVLDADGINAFAPHPEKMKNDEGMPVVITPHPGEMARLLGTTIARVQKNRIETARAGAQDHGCFVILKGYQTIIASPSGRILVNPTGNPGMATGGTGDVLAGMAGRFVAAWYRRFHGSDHDALADYLAAAVYLHGYAGDLAAEKKGEESLIATDLIEHLPAAFRRVRTCTTGELPAVSLPHKVLLHNS